MTAPTPSLLVDAYINPAVFLERILTDEESVSRLVEELDKIKKVLSDLVLVSIFYEIATRIGLYTRGTIQNVALILAVLVGYIINPIDIIPDVLPAVGSFDDVLAAFTVIGIFYVKFLRDFARDATTKDFMSKVPDGMLHPKIKERMLKACSTVAQLNADNISDKIASEISSGMLMVQHKPGKA